ncbi:IS3 family transposase, partial [Immundisolibacter sp.]
RLYASGEYRRILEEHGVLPSMGRTGDCYDNTPAESFFSTLKNELVHGIHFQDRDHARREVVSYIEGFYNRRRLYQALGYLSPTAFEHRLAVSSLTRPSNPG